MICTARPRRQRTVSCSRSPINVIEVSERPSFPSSSLGLQSHSHHSQVNQTLLSSIEPSPTKLSHMTANFIFLYSDPPDYPPCGNHSDISLLPLVEKDLSGQDHSVGCFQSHEPANGQQTPPTSPPKAVPLSFVPLILIGTEERCAMKAC